MSTLAEHGPRTDRFDRRLLAPMMLGSILNPINSSIIAVALVPIAAAFGAPASETAWLVSSLYLATSIGQPLIGRLVDAFGPRRLFLVGACLTLAAGLIGTFAPNIGVLIVARVVLGFGTCAGYPASMYLIRSESARTGIASPAGVLTALSVATQTIAVVGPTLGGLLIGLGGWRATFAVNVPLAIACIVLGLLVLPRRTHIEVDGAPDPAPDRFRLDLVGILLFATTLVSLLLFLMDLRVDTLWLLGVTVLAAVGFAVRELRTAEPFIDVRVFAGNLPLVVTYARGVAAATVSYSFLYGSRSGWRTAGASALPPPGSSCCPCSRPASSCPP
ncbi:MFS transporter [Curtobacterium flaccumfaciens]|nr:MFS transporter [Curtobacterium flaccumfaciens]